MTSMYSNRFSVSFKKGKRVYPITDNPMDVKPVLQNNKNQNHSRTNETITQNFSKISLLTNEPNRNLDVAFLGNSPLVNDLNVQPPVPRIPASASITSQNYSQCNSKYQKCTLNALPQNASLLKKSKLPLSLLIEPYPRESNNEVPKISNGKIVRCARCKSFINPFIQFINDGLKWQCNICGSDDNTVPPSYDWDHITRQKIDRWSIPELNYGCVDYVATSEFLARPPQPLVYVFVIDTTTIAIETGMIKVFAEGLMECIDQIPNSDGRTRVGFITANHAIGFYSLTNKHPELIIMPEIDDIYLPRACSDLVVNLSEAKTVIMDLLERFKDMFSNQTNINNSNCFGSALKAAHLLLSSTGGKIVCLQASLPNIGVGALPPSIIHRKKCTTTSDGLLLEPTSEFYKSFSEECVESHICADMFVFGSHSVDVPTLNVIPRFTGGQTYYYPGFNTKNKADGEKFKFELQKFLQEDSSLEAIMRTKCSPGLVCKYYYGNFSFQAPNILVLPNVSRDGSYCIEMAIEGDLYGDLAYIQTCMLYTTSSRERLIRVMTTCLPIVKKLSEVFYNSDQLSIVRAMGHQAIDRAMTLKIRDGKEYLVQHTTAICRAYSKEITGVTPSKCLQVSLCRSLSMLLALTLSLLKSEAFNDNGIVPINISTQSATLLRTLPSSLWSRYVYPTLYCLHNMPAQCGAMDANGQFIMPPRLNLTNDRLERHGCYLLENGQRILIWVGRNAVPQLCLDLLDAASFKEVIPGQMISLPILNNPFSRKVHCILDHIRTNLRHSNFYPTLYLVKEDESSMLHNWFMTHLLEDRQQLLSNATNNHTKESIPNSSMSYYQWLSFIKESI